MRSFGWLTQIFSIPLFFLHFQAVSSTLLFPNSSYSPTKILCHRDESISLINFKNSFSIGSSSYLQDSYPKTESWKEGTNCCGWNGVICDMRKGYVIGLNLSSSMLYGSFPSDSSLFLLSHLQYIDLSYNDFNSSLISSHFGHFSNLRYLNLSNSNFAGQVPSEISLLSKLVSIDLSRKNDNPFGNDLFIETTVFNKLVKHLTMLRELDLSFVNMSLIVPDSLKHLSSSLSSISLSNCKLSGKFPGAILQLPNLRFLDLGGNEGIIGFSPPTSNWSTSLLYLLLSYTSIPIDFVSNFNSLEKLKLVGCKFVGSNLALLGNLTKLDELHLSPNDFNGIEIPYSFGNLVKLTSLDLSFSNFSGQIPSSLGNLKRLSNLDLRVNKLSGQIPSSLGNLTQLTGLYLNDNNLNGHIPSSLGNLEQLSDLYLGANNLNGQIPTSFGNLKQLSFLDLSNNNLSGHIPFSLGNLTQLSYLLVDGNKLGGSVPSSLGNLTQLQTLYLSNNQLTGPIPSQLGKLSILSILDLSNNFLNETIPVSFFNLPSLNKLMLHNNLLTGQIPQFNASLYYIDFSHNKLHGPIPTSIFKQVNLLVLSMSSNNKLTGQISSSICKLETLLILDLSNNTLSGPIPKCLGDFSNNLQVLHLGMNHFSGTIPSTFLEGSCSLRYINFYSNEFQGPVPRSLINCTNLEFLNLGANMIIDTFPFFLGVLPNLQLLVLRSNKLHGFVNNFSSNNSFSQLQIFDLSNNSLSGPLPSDYFDHLEAMMMMNSGSTFRYMGEEYIEVYDFDFDFSVQLIVKGLEVELVKIQNLLSTIDLSQNNFTGKIPKSIGKLKALINLNLSHNCLEDNIQSTIGNLTNLESLDLSSNSLVGMIPKQLLDLKFLAVFSVSYNQLEGPIPHGKQFNTFDNSSYKGNKGLCGFPLTRECNGGQTQELNPSKGEDPKIQSDESGFGWEAVVVGFGVGIGYIIVFKTRKRSWFVRMIETEGYL